MRRSRDIIARREKRYHSLQAFGCILGLLRSMLKPGLSMAEPGDGASGKALDWKSSMENAFTQCGLAIAGASDEVSPEVASGKTTFVTRVDPGVPFVDGATMAPEPSSVVLSRPGIIAFAVALRRKRSPELS